MDVSAIATMATEMSQARTAEAVQVAVLKKALDLQEQGAMQLVAAASQVIPSNPPHLGTAVDTVA